MPWSRREFVRDSMLAVGGLATVPESCARSRGASASGEVVAATRVFEPAYLELERSGELVRREAALWELYSSCRCCPRECGADRLAGETGVCSSTAELKASSAFAHRGEERPLVGSGGSGTVFFSNCNLLCVFCQNWQVNHRGDGRSISHRELARTMLGLQEMGCHNINLVTPTHVLPAIVKGLRIAIRDGLRLPLVYNTGGYDSLEAVRLLDGIVDIYLPDFKYQDGKLAATYSFEASDYPDVAAAVIAEMHRQVGDLVVNESGVATRGLIVRHLVMPHNIAGTDRFVKWVADRLSPATYVNIMAQYRPEHRSREYPNISRKITRDEWRQALAWAEEAGLRRLDR